MRRYHCPVCKKPLTQQEYFDPQSAFAAGRRSVQAVEFRVNPGATTGEADGQVQKLR
jgi:hypothetical protein